MKPELNRTQPGPVGFSGRPGSPAPAGRSLSILHLHTRAWWARACLLSLVLLWGLALSSGLALGVVAETSGQPLMFRSLDIVGAKIIPGKDVREELAMELPSRWPWKKPPVFKREELESDIDRLYLYYRRHGFYHVQIDAETRIKDGQVRAEIIIREGPWVKVTKIEVKGAEIPGAALAKIQETSPLKPGKRFTEPSYEGLKRDYLGYFLDHGHPYAKIDGKILLDEEANTAEILLTLSPGPWCYFGEVILKGDGKTPERVIRRKLTFKPGDLFSLKEIYESQRLLYSLDLFQNVSLTPQEVPPEQSHIPLILEVQEKKQRSLKVGLGYGTEDRFRARLGVRWRNLGGGARLLDIDAKYSFLEARLTGTLLNPQIFDTSLNLVLQTGLVRRSYPSINNFTDKAFFTQALLERDLPWKWRLSFGHVLEFDRPFNIPLETLLLLQNTSPGATYRASMALLRLRQDTTNDPVDPSRGGIISMVGEVAPTFLGSSLQFASAVAEARRYQSLGETKVILAGRLKFGIIEPIQDTTEIPLFRRFFCGGASSVRGYRLDYLGPRTPNGTPTGGTALVEGSLEARIPIYKQFRGVAFLDFGNVYLKPRDIDLGQLKYASGVGLRYQTPVGPLGLDVGFPLNPIDPRQDTYRIYFTIGQAF